MGLFDIFRKKEATTIAAKPAIEPLENFPEMLTAKLLFKEKPVLEAEKILRELKHYLINVVAPRDGAALLFAFPDFQIELVDAKIPAQCLVAIPDEKFPEIELPEVAFQQNWHWAEASETAKTCRFELMVTDFMATSLPYKQRVNLFMSFMVAVTKGTNPNVVYSVHGQKLIKPTELIRIWDDHRTQTLYGICNVRLYNISDTADKEMLMDTVGLNALGLPDFQIRFSASNPTDIANLLWNYAYYVYEHGDIIVNGNTLEGLVSRSKWKCERLISPLQPERVIINVVPN